MKKKEAIFNHSIDKEKLKNTTFSIGIISTFTTKHYLEIILSCDQDKKKSMKLDLISLIKMKENFIKNFDIFDGLLTINVNIFIHIVQKLIK